MSAQPPSNSKLLHIGGTETVAKFSSGKADFYDMWLAVPVRHRLVARIGVWLINRAGIEIPAGLWPWSPAEDAHDFRLGVTTHKKGVASAK